MRRGFRVTAWALMWLVVRAGGPALMRPVQSHGWAKRWRAVVSPLAHPFTQCLAVAWSSLMWFAFGVPWPWLLLWSPWPSLILQGPACLAVMFGLGRHLYPLTPRGRCRSRYPNPDGFMTYDRWRRNVSPMTVKLHAVHGRPSVERALTPPSVGKPSAYRMLRLPVSQCGTFVGRCAIGMPLTVGRLGRCYVPHEATVGYVAIPREWKTAQLENNILDHDGPGLSTQTKPETFLRTAPVRALRGPVRLMDPEGTTGQPSNIRWNPIAGCRDPHVAMENAAGLSSGVKTNKDVDGDQNAWFREQAAVVLRALLLTADVAGKTMEDVYVWASGGLASMEEPLGLMQRHKGQVPKGWREALVGVMNTKAEKTRDGIMMVLAGSVGWAADAATLALATPAEGETFDAETFLRSHGMIYLIATEREYAPAGPLLAAFTHHLFETAKRVAGLHRLDPVLGLFLDEIAQTIPLPLDKWLADSGGRGIHIVWSAQARSQLVQRYGRAGADTVWTATTAKVLGGGSTVPDDLRDYSLLTGNRKVWEDGKRVSQPVMSAPEVEDIPRWHGLLITREVVTLVRLFPSWRRPDVLAAKLRRWHPKLTPLMVEAPPEPAPALTASGAETTP